MILILNNVINYALYRSFLSIFQTYVNCWYIEKPVFVITFLNLHFIENWKLHIEILGIFLA